MKKTITVVLFFLSSIIGFSQNIVILDTGKNLVSNTIIDIPIATNSSNAYELLVTNVNPNISHWDTIKVTRTILVDDAGDATQFCWGGVCYGFPVNLSSLSLVVHPADTFNYAQNGFHALFSSDASNITRIVHYTFFDIHNTSDSTGVTLRYNTNLGINELSSIGGSISNAFPNPASSAPAISYKLNDNTKKGKLVLYDVLGKQVKEIFLNDKQGTARIATDDLKAGIYFYSLFADDKIVSTKKDSSLSLIIFSDK